MMTLFAASGPNMLAQITPPTADGLHAWLASGVAVAGIYYLVLKIVQGHRKADRNPSFDVEMKGFASRDSVARLEIELPKMATKVELGEAEHRITANVDAQAKAQDARRSTGIGNLHGRIETIEKEHVKEMKIVLATLAEVAANQRTNTAAIMETNRKLDVLVDRSARHRN